VAFPEQSALAAIYSTFVRGHFETLPFKVPVQEAANSCLKAALTLHSLVSTTYRKTAKNMHYEFNLRHMSRVFSGLLQAKPSEFVEPEKVVLLWIHESWRIYADGLVTVADVNKFRSSVGELVKKMFAKYNFQKYFQKYFQEKNPESLTFAPFSKGIHDMGDGGCYDKIKDIDHLAEILQEALREYNSSYAAMDLVLFEDAMKHVARYLGYFRVLQAIRCSSGLEEVAGKASQD